MITDYRNQIRDLPQKPMIQLQIRHPPPRIERNSLFVVGETEEILGVIDTGVVPLTQPGLHLKLGHQGSETSGLEVRRHLVELCEDEVMPGAVQGAGGDVRRGDERVKEAG